jgi:hypothetical protein
MPNEIDLAIAEDMRRRVERSLPHDVLTDLRQAGFH